MILDRSVVHSFQGTHVITAICIAFLVIPSVAFDDAPTLDPKIATRSPHETANSDSCVGQCAFVFVDEMTAQMGDGRSTANLLNLNYNDFLAAFSNASFFEKFASNLYHTFNYCYTKCPQGYMQELLQRSSEIVDHFCVYNYKAIMEKFGCLSGLDRNVSKQCLKSCTSHHDAVTSLMQNFKQLALNGDSTQAEHYLAESCE
uniref:Uncharacterized protein n=1 Tax=Ditylenchus dipsaci TaxID=166011 RepID=A0A915DBZ3_9BILA